MYYKFNSLIGRITPSTQAETYNPQGLNPLRGAPSVIVFDSSRTKIAREPAVTMKPAGGAAAAASPQEAAAATSQGLRLGVVPYTARYRKIMEMQNMFLKEDGKLVWQKLGRDRIGYLGTLALMTVGTALSISVLFRMSFPRPSEE